MAKVSGYGVSAGLSGKEGLTLFLLILGIIIVAMWYLKSQTIDKIYDPLKDAAGAVSNAVTQTAAQVTNPQNTTSALAGDVTPLEYEYYVAHYGSAAAAARYPGYETPESVQTRLSILPEWEQSLVNTGNFIGDGVNYLSGGLIPSISDVSASMVGKTTNPNTRFQIGDTIIYNSPFGGSYWKVEDITATQYVLSSFPDGSTSYNPLIKDVDYMGSKF